MIIAEIIERIQSLYSVGVSNDETRLSDRHVYNKTLTVRMQLLSQQLKKKQRTLSTHGQGCECSVRQTSISLMSST